MSIFPAGYLNSHKDDADDAIDTLSTVTLFLTSVVNIVLVIVILAKRKQPLLACIVLRHLNSVNILNVEINVPPYFSISILLGK